MMKTGMIAAALLLTTAMPLAGAMAADLPVPEVPMIAAAPAEAFSWSGFYAGVHLGYAWGEASRRGASTGDSDSVIGGGQVGINWQLGAFVLGAEADISGLGGEADSSTPGGVTVLRTEPTFFGTVRGRAGIAFDRVLVYGTGGLAYGGFDQQFQVLGRKGSDSGTQVGWTAGGGVEVALTENVTLRAEYLYADLGSTAYRFRTPVGTSRLDVDYTQQLARVGVNYKF
jgi:outer membrane immunogenic protein